MSYLSPVHLRNEPRLSFYEMPAGKPSKADPTQRVVQKEQKGCTCWFYAYKRVLTEGDEEQQKTLRFYSQIRKKITALGETPDIDEANKIVFTALDSLKIDYKKIVNDGFKKYGLQGNYLPWNDLSPNQQQGTTLALLTSSFIMHSQLTVSAWRPTDPIEFLINELNKNGPCVFRGQYGLTAYKTMPFSLKKMEGREIFAWKKNQRMETNPYICHGIVVIGAEKTKKRELIYYIDPNDKSDPANPSSQRIYLITYRSFITHLYDLSSVHYCENRPSPNGYGVYKKLPPPEPSLFSYCQIL